VVHDERSVGQRTHALDLSAQRVRRAEDAGDRPDRTGAGHRGHQLWRGRWPDRRLEDRGLDVEELAEGRAEHDPF
jgi:hypothetical protein